MFDDDDVVGTKRTKVSVDEPCAAPVAHSAEGARTGVGDEQNSCINAFVRIDKASNGDVKQGDEFGLLYVVR